MTLSASGRQAAIAAAGVAAGDAHARLTFAAYQNGMPHNPSSAPADSLPGRFPRHRTARACTRNASPEAGRPSVGQRCSSTSGSPSEATQLVRGWDCGNSRTLYAVPPAWSARCKSGCTDRRAHRRVRIPAPANQGAERTPRTTRKPAIREENPPWPDTST